WPAQEGPIQMNDERGYRKIVVVLLLLLMVGAAALIIFYPHQVQVTVEGEGAVDPMEGETSIIDGLTLGVMPDDGWVIGQVTVDGDRVDVTDNRVTVSPSPFDFSAIDVVVTFTPDSDMSTLTVTSEGGGDASPMGTTAQVHGSTVTVTASPDEGSVIDEVLVDGVSVGSTNSIDVLMDADHSVHVVFREVTGSDIPITVTVDVDIDVVMTTLGSFYDWGDVEPHGTVYVEPGSSLTITVSLNPGFEVEDFTIDGVSDGSKLEHVLTDIHAPVEIGIFIFGYVNGYTVTASAGSGGSITPSGESIVAEGDDIKFTLSPRSSYAVSHILLDGERVNVSGRTYTLTDVRDNHTVQVFFKYVGGGGGSSDYHPILESIEVSGTFDRDYTVGQKFDSTGMVVIANYSDGSSTVVSDYTVTPSGGLTISDTTITVSYSESGITCQCPVIISVSDTPKELEVIPSGFYEAG
ncbi:MAG: bacterial Ig-like domain-containing protein, partial [Candidatus Methanomethylophilaceae archaeon]|nr:bacterial Ig-like domain-containing protein [Candidatus Methanomethylophilaceae archaeon]